MSKPEIHRDPLSKETIQRLADDEFGNMVKFVVDLEREVICAGGGLHSDEEGMLLDDGSRQTNLWGANFYLDRPAGKRLVYTSMINIRPSDGNTKQEIMSPELRDRVRALADRFFEAFK
jgi:hypothetical protein